jgi:hypothetical protein
MFNGPGPGGRLTAKSENKKSPFLKFVTMQLYNPSNVALGQLTHDTAKENWGLEDVVFAKLLMCPTTSAVHGDASPWVRDELQNGTE